MKLFTNEYKEKYETLVIDMQYVEEKLKQTSRDYEAMLDIILKERREHKREIEYYYHEGYKRGIGSVSKDQPSKFNASDLSSIIRLCHPDKHNNSKVATRITQVLLKMR